MDKINPLKPNSLIKKPTVNPKIYPLIANTPNIKGMPITVTPKTHNRNIVFRLLKSEFLNSNQLSIFSIFKIVKNPWIYDVSSSF